LIPQPHLGFLTALLKDKNFEFYKEDKLSKKICR